MTYIVMEGYNLVSERSKVNYNIFADLSVCFLGSWIFREKYPYNGVYPKATGSNIRIFIQYTSLLGPGEIYSTHTHTCYIYTKFIFFVQVQLFKST